MKDYVITKVGLMSLYMQTVFEAACNKGASDIHIDPQEDFVLIRFRVLGTIETYECVDKKLKEEIVGRIKVLAKIRTDVHDTAQDGRFTFLFRTEKVDMRVSVVPTFYGENAVIRLLRPRLQRDISFPSLGFNQIQYSIIEDVLERGKGMVLVSGATGSGKTTTIYACVQYLKDQGKNIVTIEDPVEYVVPGVRQIQIQEKTFPFIEGLKAVLRQDPEVIVIGEIRDSDTAQLAFRAALTGHLVIASIHADKAKGVIGRLVDLGVSKNVLPLIQLIIGQELMIKMYEGKVTSRIGVFDVLSGEIQSLIKQSYV